MSLLAPAWLALAAFCGLVLILHMRRRRTADIPSIQLWRQIDGGRQSRQPVRLQRPSPVLLLQLLVAVLIALALARPLIGGGHRYAHEIFVLDASGGMRMTDVAPSRFDAATGELTALAAGPVKDSGARISVILAAARPQIVAARLDDPNGLGMRPERLRAGDGDADWPQVHRLVSAVLRHDERTRIVLITDGDSGGAAALAEAFPDATIETKTVRGPTARNAGLRAAPHAVDAGAGKWRAEGAVMFSPGFTGAATVTALVQPEGTDGFLEWGRAEVRPATPATSNGDATETNFALDLDVKVGGAIVMRLEDDDGPQDNAVQFIVHPEPRTLRILELGPVSEALNRALRAAGRVELLSADVLPADTSTFDLVVANGIEIAGRPATNTLWLGSARAAGENAAGPGAATAPALWQSDHPLSRSVSWSSVKPTRASAFPRWRGAVAVAESDAAALVEARTTAVGREVRVAFDLDSSNWPEQPGFPLFVSNLLHWVAPDFGRTIEAPCVVGKPCEIDPRLLGAEVVPVAATQTGSGASTAGKPDTRPAPSRTRGVLPRGYDAGFVLDRAGLYRLRQNGLTHLVAVNAPAGAVDGPHDGAGAAAMTTSHRVGTAWRWLLVAAFAALVAEAVLAGRGSERFLQRSSLASGNPLAARRRGLLALRVAALAFLALAIGGMPILVPDRSQNVVAVVSPGFDAGRAGLLDQVANARGRDDAGGPVDIGLVVVDANARIATDLGDTPSLGAGATPPAAPAGADLETSLALAAAMLPDGAPGRIIVASDGNETRGNSALAVPLLRDRGLAVDAAPRSYSAPGEVLVEKVSVPDRVYAGDFFPLEAVVYSHGPSSVTARITKDGETVVDRSLDLADGRSRIEIVMPPAIAGRVRYDVVVDAPHDAFPQNNRNGIVLDVAPAPQVLIVAAEPAWAEVFAKALAVQEIAAKIVEPKRAPFYLKDWLAYSAIVLMNVPAIDLTTLQQELIEKAVADHGRGLLLLGGENSFGPGGYYETPLERLSPLSSRVPREAPRVALAFVLDRSGSMQRDEGGATRLDIAKQATVSAIRLLHQESQIAIVAFDSEAKVLLPLRQAKDTAAVEQALRQLEPGGGTSIYPGLVEALHQLDGVDAMAKHIVVMSDGLTQPGDFPGILKAISDQGISVSTVSIGEGADGAVLQDIARLGKGAFHATRDFKALPSILSQEALLLSGKPVEERSAAPTFVQRASEFFGGLADRMPPVTGYVLTTRKPEADLNIVVADEKQEPVPLFASWRYGNGRVVSLTSHGAGAWTRDWQAMPEYPLLWSQVVRHIFPGAGEGLAVRARRDGDEVEVTVDRPVAEDPSRPAPAVTASLAGPGPDTDTAVPLKLSEIAPGHYRGHFTAERDGAFVVRAAAGQGGAEAPIFVAYPAIYDFSRADPDRLAALAAATGGRVLSREDPLFAPGERRWTARAGWPLWTLIAFGLFMIDLIVRYLSGLSRSKRPGADAR
jgi:Mg-chelatase subunit ChlD